MYDKGRCKKRRYGNCGPIKEGDEYCLFHKPNKNRKEAINFYERVQDQAKKVEIIEDDKGSERKRFIFDDRIDWKGYSFPDIPKNEQTEESSFSFSYTLFNDTAIFQDAIFEGTADFWRAEFEKANFKSTVFKKTARFLTVEFELIGFFEDAIFGNDAIFLGAKFGIIGANFGDAKFKGFANFNGVKFNAGAYFKGAQFEEGVEFLSVKFGGPANFKHAHFGKGTRFQMVEFKNMCNFAKATFLGNLSFSGIDFRKIITLVEDLGEIEFGVITREVWVEEKVIEKKLAKLNRFEKGTIMKKINIWKIINNTVEIEEKSFKSHQFSKLRNFTERIKKDLGRDPTLSISKLEVKQVKNKFQLPQAKEEGCRIQRISYEKEGRKEDADKMFAHEMQARREQKEGKLAQLIEKLIADWTCEYGTNWQRVLKLSGISIFISTLFYWLGNIGLLPGNTYAIAVNGTVISKLGDSLYYSIITFTTLSYGYLHPNGWLMKTVSASESLAGALFTALIIVVFARKWMRG